MLLDTNIVGYFFRGDSRAKPYERHLTGQTRYIAFVTLGELYQWLFLRPFSEANKQRLLEHIAQHVGRLAKPCLRKIRGSRRRPSGTACRSSPIIAGISRTCQG